MPLIKSKSKSAFSHNVGAEMDSGKSQKQSLAIAYATKRRAKKMSMGGMVNDPDEDVEDVKVDDSFLSAEDGSESQFQDAHGESDADELDESGFNPEPKMDNESGNSMLSDIMEKIRRKNMRG
jgi:hypothetical protein